MTEFFIVANSKAAPIVSDTSQTYVQAESPKEAMEEFIAGYSHPAGLYAVNVYSSADAFHKDEDALLEWRSPEAIRAHGLER